MPVLQICRIALLDFHLQYYSDRLVIDTKSSCKFTANIEKSGIFAE